jgi:hypothetical protein
LASVLNSVMDWFASRPHRVHKAPPRVRKAGLSDALSETTVFGDLAPLLDGLPKPDADPQPQSNRVFKIRLARSRTIREDVTNLVERRYASRGYQIADAEPNLFTFVASDRGVPMGTVSVRIDAESPLVSEESYPKEIADLRAAGYRLCEYTRLALDDKALSKEVLAALFHTTYLYARRVRNLTHAIIEVNPRHVAFYRRALLFKVIGEERPCARVEAPAVLMLLDYAVLDEVLDKFFAQPDWREQTRSLFVHAFPPTDAAGIVGRLQNLGTP